MSEFIIPKKFDLAQTLDCGQAFRWEPVDDSAWSGIAFGRPLTIRQTGDSHILTCSGDEYESIWRSYFDLDEDYDGIKERLSSLSPVLKEASQYAPGIRILRQDPWEAICSFIISQNNNIPRIKGIIKRFCQLLGEDTGQGCTFPTAERVSACTVEDLAPIRSGFRAKYIISAAKTVAENPEFLTGVYELAIDDARKRLMEIKGIGPKVADCALLYGFHRTECFPLDVWMKRAMAVLLPENTPGDFGADAGIAQQYIFHYSRMHPELFKEEDRKVKTGV